MRFLDNSDIRDVLEVGGGTTCHVPVSGARYTVIDISADALERNHYASEKIVADAQGFDYGSKRFDAAVFWNVLEHLPDPESAVTAALRHVRDQGYVIIAGPILSSLKAIITRWTPHDFHVAVYRRLFRKHDAGTNGSAPFPVRHSQRADLGEMIALLEQNDCEIVMVRTFVGKQVRRIRMSSPLLFKAYRALNAALRFVTLGRLGSEETEFLLLARKVPRSEAIAA